MGRIVKAHEEATEAEVALIRLAWARDETYFWASLLMLLQLSVTILLPLAGAALAVAVPAARPYVALAALAVTLLEVSALDRPQRLMLERAARLGDQFDCAALDLPWDSFVVGEKIAPEDIDAAATARLRRAHKPFGGWYPDTGAAAPHLARIICQYTNLRYDWRLRQIHSAIVAIALLALVGGLIAWGVAANLKLEEAILALFTPAAPVIAWGLRDLVRQREAIAMLETLRREADILWNAAVAGDRTPPECRAASRNLQSAIYVARATNPLILPGVYGLHHQAMEAQMRAGTAGRLAEAENLTSA